MLTPAERVLLFRACWNHPVARCEQCGRSYKLPDLAVDPLRRLSHLCPLCRIDLTNAARQHLISCGAAARLDAQNVVAEARALCETSAMIRKDAQQARDTARLLRAEADAARQRRAESSASVSPRAANRMP